MSADQATAKDVFYVKFSDAKEDGKVESNATHDENVKIVLQEGQQQYKDQKTEGVVSSGKDVKNKNVQEYKMRMNDKHNEQKTVSAKKIDVKKALDKDVKVVHNAKINEYCHKRGDSQVYKEDGIAHKGGGTKSSKQLTGLFRDDDWRRGYFVGTAVKEVEERKKKCWVEF